MLTRATSTYSPLPLLWFSFMLLQKSPSTVNHSLSRSKSSWGTKVFVSMRTRWYFANLHQSIIAHAKTFSVLWEISCNVKSSIIWRKRIDSLQNYTIVTNAHQCTLGWLGSSECVRTKYRILNPYKVYLTLYLCLYLSFSQIAMLNLLLQAGAATFQIAALCGWSSDDDDDNDFVATSCKCCQFLTRLPEGLERVLQNGKPSEFNPQDYKQVKSSPSQKVWSHESVKVTEKFEKRVKLRVT